MSNSDWISIEAALKICDDEYDIHQNAVKLAKEAMKAGTVTATAYHQARFLGEERALVAARIRDEIQALPRK